MAKSLLLNGVAFVFHSYTPLYPYFIAFYYCPAGPTMVPERALIYSEAFSQNRAPDLPQMKKIIALLWYLSYETSNYLHLFVQTVITNGLSSARGWTGV